MRNKILTKQSVLEAAEKIIVKDGMSSCSMRRIASGLGVAVGTIYNYYDSREELLIELFTISWDRTVANARKLVDPSECPWRQIERIINLVEDDVKNRNGLGKDIYIFHNYQEEVLKNTLNIRDMLTEVIVQVLNQKVDAEEANLVLGRWLMTVLIDALIAGRRIDDFEMNMIRQVVELDFE